MRLADSQRKAELAAWLSDQLLPRFGDRLVSIDMGVMLRWGQLMGPLERQGKTLAAIDSLIAASALYAGLSLVTRNERDFADSSVTIVNPWRL